MPECKKEGHHDDHDLDCQKDCLKGKDTAHFLPGPLLLECGNGGGFTFTDSLTNSSDENTTCICEPQTAASVVIDTTCFCRPNIKTEFSSILHFIPDCNGYAKLEFDFVRCCKDFPECVLRTWNFEANENDKFSRPFCFDHCDLNSCPGCCIYMVKARPVCVKRATVCATNCQMAVFAQENQH